MKHRLDVFSPQTYQRFTMSDRSIAGVKPRYRALASSVTPGDLLLCYTTKLSRWCGVLKVTSTAFEDPTPRFADADDPSTPSPSTRTTCAPSSRSHGLIPRTAPSGPAACTPPRWPSPRTTAPG